MALFWLKSSSSNIFWPIKLTFWIFVIFCNHFKEDLKFGYFNPLAPTLWGTPLAHLLHDLPWNLCYPTSLSMKIFGKIITIFATLYYEGYASKRPLYGPDRPTAKKWCGLKNPCRWLTVSYKPHNVSKLSTQAFFAFLGNPEHASMK